MSQPKTGRYAEKAKLDDCFPETSSAAVAVRCANPVSDHDAPIVNMIDRYWYAPRLGASAISISSLHLILKCIWVA
jgi:hypothetical protein